MEVSLFAFLMNQQQKQESNKKNAEKLAALVRIPLFLRRHSRCRKASWPLNRRFQGRQRVQ